MRVWGLFGCDDLSHEGSSEGLYCLHISPEAALTCWANTWGDSEAAWVEEPEDVWTLYQFNDREWRSLTIYAIEVES